MAITCTNPLTGQVTLKYVGQVLQIFKFVARRNMSDTLDYSDYQDVRCVEALVYLGRTATEKRWFVDRYLNPGDEIPVQHRFTRVDCSNHFVWRGCDSLEPVVDLTLDSDPIVRADWEAHERFLAEEAAKAKAAAEARQAAIEADLKAKEERRAKRQAKVEAKLATVPPKGTLCKLGDFTGTLFWTGTRHGAPRVGLKRGGEVQFGNPEELTRA